MSRCKRLRQAALVSAFLLLLSIPQVRAVENGGTISLKDRLSCGWALLRANTLYPERLPDWQSCQEQFARNVDMVDQKTADEAMSELVSLVHDDYTFFRDRAHTAEFRESIEQRSAVRFNLDNNGVAHITIGTFVNKHVAMEMRDALQMLAEANSYVLDLRGNKGGLVNQAFIVYSMFVDEGAFAVFKGRTDGNSYVEALNVSRKRLERKHNGKLTTSARIANLTANKPLTILVDGDTRSAAELLAGALRDCGRARLVGTRTFGKGVGQDTWTLSDGSSVRITTGRSYLLKSGCIDGCGLEPDITRDMPSDDAILP